MSDVEVFTHLCFALPSVSPLQRRRTIISTPNALLSELIRIRGVFPAFSISYQAERCLHTDQPDHTIGDLFATNFNRSGRNSRDSALPPPLLR